LLVEGRGFLILAGGIKQMRIEADPPPTKWTKRWAQILDGGLRSLRGKPTTNFVTTGDTLRIGASDSAGARISYGWGSTTEETLDALKRAVKDLQDDADAAFSAIQKETGERKSGDATLRNELAALDQRVARQTKHQTEHAVGTESKAMRWFLAGLGLAIVGISVGC
jgi:hypothetical protein